MRIKKLGAALAVVAALGTVLASSALASAVTRDALWRVGGAVLSGAAEVGISQVGPTTTFKTTSGGFAIELHSTGIECSECKLENSGGTAVGSGKLKFTGVTVASPSGCSVAGTITTNKLRWNADYMSGSTSYILFEPAAGPENGFATVTLTGGSCPIKTAIIPKGTLFVQTTNATGIREVEQQMNSSAAINSAAGGSLHVGEETASLEGSAKFKLLGTHAGEAFGNNGGEEEGGGGGGGGKGWFFEIFPGTLKGKSNVQFTVTNETGKAAEVEEFKVGGTGTSEFSEVAGHEMGPCKKNYMNHESCAFEWQYKGEANATFWVEMVVGKVGFRSPTVTGEP